MSHVVVIIHADSPVMPPYMSRAIGTIHAQQAAVTMPSEPRTSQRSCKRARSSAVRLAPRAFTAYRTTPRVDQWMRARCA